MVSGNGKLYSEKNLEGDLKIRLIYDGDFKEGKYYGSGKQYNEETHQLMYDGGFVDGEYEGFGKRYLEDGSMHEFNFKQGKLFFE